VSDFGFDAYALDDADTAGHPHPLEIARDLIATGKPRSALEVLSLHHEQLADDPEYLLLCAEAWQADGDSLHAQQALLGAARLAPEDPRPLEWLGELLAEKGEHEKAERVRAKARALEARGEEPLDEMGPEAEDDLIAFAERQERSQQAALTPRQILFGVAALVGIALLIGVIAFVSSPRKAASPPRGSAPPVLETPASDEGDAIAEPAQASAGEIEQIPTRQIEKLAPPVDPELVAAPSIVETEEVVEVETPRKAALPPRSSTPATEVAQPKPKPKPKVEVSAAPKEPNAAVVEAELASLNPKQLTVRAEALYVQGHSGLAASYYRRALEIDPDYAPALVGIGQSILRAKKYSEAMKNATRALQLARGVDARPGLEAAAIYQMGRVHYERGELDASRRLFRQSISLPGTPAQTWFYLGEALSSDNSPAAREAYERYLELVPKGHLADRARRAIR
jgi:Flp pilus assembly protein TadD